MRIVLIQIILLKPQTSFKEVQTKRGIGTWYTLNITCPLDFKQTVTVGYKHKELSLGLDNSQNMRNTNFVTH